MAIMKLPKSRRRDNIIILANFQFTNIQTSYQQLGHMQGMGKFHEIKYANIGLLVLLLNIRYNVWYPPNSQI